MSQLKRRHLGNTPRQQQRRYVPSFGRGGETLSFASVDYIYLAVCQLEYFSQRRVVIFVVFSLLYPLHSYLFVAIARYCLSCLVLDWDLSLHHIYSGSGPQLCSGIAEHRY